MSVCERQLEMLLEALINRDYWALNFFDTWGLQSGILHGRSMSPGLFADCMNYRYGDIEGKYCQVGVRALDSFDYSKNDSLSLGTLLHDMMFKNQISTTSGICIPRSCSEYDIKKFSETLLGSNNYEWNIGKCFEPPKFEGFDAFVISVFTVFFLLAAISTVYDLVTRGVAHEPRKLLTIFSFPANFKELMKINKSESSINCIDGIKVLAAITIILGHRSDWMQNPWPRFWLGRFVRMAIGMYHNSVDTFLVCSALLITQSMLRTMKNLENFNLTRTYVVRYLRYLPAIAILVIFFASNLPVWIADGPFTDVEGRIWNCRKWWWSSLLFIQNFANVDEICHDHTWYLSVDFQLFLMTPAIVYILSQYGRRSVRYFVLLIVTFQAFTFYNLAYNYESWSYYYKKTQYRFAEYLVGILGGYLMFNCNRRMKLNRIVVFIGWTLSLSILGSHVFYNLRNSLPEMGRYFYDSVVREAWACSICWIIFACHHLESGGPIRSFLSHHFWQPLSKMCLSIYLIHFLYIELTVMNEKEHHVDNLWWQIHIHIGDVVISTLLGMIFFLLVEAPTNQAVRLFSAWQAKKKSPDTIQLPFKKLDENK